MAVATGWRVVVAAVLGTATLNVACREDVKADAAPTAHPLIIATGMSGGVFDTVGSALAVAYNGRLTHVSAATRASGTVEENLDAIESGAAQLGFVDSESAYIGVRTGTPASARPHGRVRAVAVLFPTVVHVFTRRDVGISSPANLGGRRLAVGGQGGYGDQALSALLSGYRVPAPPARHFGAIDIGELQSGAVDGAVVFAPIWHRTIADIVTHADVALLPLDRKGIARVQASTERNHFLKSTLVPANTYPRQTTDVLTVGEDVLLLCRDDLPDPLVYNLTRVLFESIPALAKAHPAARSIDVERGATASIPLHPGALQYYRERDLPR